MKINLANWSVNKKLALLAFLMGFAALFLHDPTKARIVAYDMNEIAKKIEDKSIYISVEWLAEKLIQKSEEFRIIDLRQEKNFKEYAIPTSANILPSEILKSNIAKSTEILLYSDDELQAVHVWFLLKSKNYKSVYILSGGINEWKEKILFPVISENAGESDKQYFNKLSEISKFFGGSPRIRNSNDIINNITSEKKELPKPSSPPPVQKSNQSKSKREGC